MAGCSGITEAGERCRAIAITGSDYCHAHHPDRADARRRSARRGGKRGGRGRPVAELSDLKKQLEDLAAGVLDGTLERGDAVVVNQIINTRARLISLERQIKETEELEERLASLEQAQEQKGGGSRWGA